MIESLKTLVVQIGFFATLFAIVKAISTLH